MDDGADVHVGMEEDAAAGVQIRHTTEESGSGAANWLNGQCVLAAPSRSMFRPSFDLSVCRSALERGGFQIPAADMEAPLSAVLELPSIRRFMVFNSAIFRFIMAPVLYMVAWCAVFSTLHLYITVTDYWVLCLSVSLVSIFLTSTVLFVLHHSNKEINLNLDVRLVQVNERMLKHKLMVGVADWVQNCTGNMKLYFVYWDMSQCLRVLTEALEERSFAASDIQNKLRSRMCHLVLVMEVGEQEKEKEEEAMEEEEEQTPLLRNQDEGCSTASNQRGDARVSNSYSLIPDASLPAQEMAYRLLMTYSAVFVKLLVSKRLSRQSHRRPPLRANHCSTAPLCLCQYLHSKILQ